MIEKRYKIKKVEEYDNSISSMKSKAVRHAIGVGVLAINTITFTLSSLVFANPITMILASASCALTIQGIIEHKKKNNEIKELMDQAKENDEVKRSAR